MHTKEICKHGKVMRQCRCPGPKTVQIVPCDHVFGDEVFDQETM